MVSSLNHCTNYCTQCTHQFNIYLNSELINLGIVRKSFYNCGLKYLISVKDKTFPNFIDKALNQKILPLMKLPSAH